MPFSSQNLTNFLAAEMAEVWRSVLQCSEISPAMFSQQTEQRASSASFPISTWSLYASGVDIIVHLAARCDFVKKWRVNFSSDLNETSHGWQKSDARPTSSRSRKIKLNLWTKWFYRRKIRYCCKKMQYPVKYSIREDIFCFSFLFASLLKLRYNERVLLPISIRLALIDQFWHLQAITAFHEKMYTFTPQNYWLNWLYLDCG